MEDAGVRRRAVQVTRNGGSAALESPDGAYVYYTQVPDRRAVVAYAGLRRRARKVLDGVLSRNFSVLDRGIYYIDQPSDEARLQFLSFATGKSTIVARNLGKVGSGLTASPDGRTILYCPGGFLGGRPDAGGELPVIKRARTIG